MGQVLHGSAHKTMAVGRANHHRQESLRSLAKRYGISQKTVAKWKNRATIADRPMGLSELTVGLPKRDRTATHCVRPLRAKGSATMGPPFIGRAGPEMQLLARPLPPIEPLLRKDWSRLWRQPARLLARRRDAGRQRLGLLESDDRLRNWGQQSDEIVY
jgi:hypothetical protein